jgi:hypothetical protein
MRCRVVRIVVMAILASVTTSIEFAVTWKRQSAVAPSTNQYTQTIAHECGSPGPFFASQIQTYNRYEKLKRRFFGFGIADGVSSSSASSQNDTTKICSRARHVFRSVPDNPLKLLRVCTRSARLSIEANAYAHQDKRVYSSKISLPIELPSSVVFLSMERSERRLKSVQVGSTCSYVILRHQKTYVESMIPWRIEFASSNLMEDDGVRKGSVGTWDHPVQLSHSVRTGDIVILASDALLTKIRPFKIMAVTHYYVDRLVYQPYPQYKADILAALSSPAAQKQIAMDEHIASAIHKAMESISRTLVDMMDTANVWNYHGKTDDMITVMGIYMHSADGFGFGPPSKKAKTKNNAQAQRHHDILNVHANPNVPPWTRAQGTLHNDNHDSARQTESYHPWTTPSIATPTSKWMLRHMKVSRFRFPQDNLVWGPRSRPFRFVFVSNGVNDFGNASPQDQANQVWRSVILEDGANRIGLWGQTDYVVIRDGQVLPLRHPNTQEKHRRPPSQTQKAVSSLKIADQGQRIQWADTFGMKLERMSLIESRDVSEVPVGDLVIVATKAVFDKMPRAHVAALAIRFLKHFKSVHEPVSSEALLTDLCTSLATSAAKKAGARDSIVVMATYIRL